MLHSFQFRQTIQEGVPLIGTLMTLDSPEVAEIVSSAGFDWIFIDLEHSPMGPLSAQRLLQSIGSACPSVIRVPNHEEQWIKKILDIGAAGILFPRVNSAAEAETILQHCKYMPQGNRSVGLARAHGYGQQFASYVENANNDVAVVMQIEDIKGAENIHEIVKVPGIDALLIGPYDLSTSMGKPGQVKDPEVVEQIEKVRQVCLDADVAVGIFTANPDDVNDFVQKGFTLIGVGIDTVIIAQTMRELVKKAKS